MGQAIKIQDRLDLRDHIPYSVIAANQTSNENPAITSHYYLDEKENLHQIIVPSQRIFDLSLMEEATSNWQMLSLETATNPGQNPSQALMSPSQCVTTWIDTSISADKFYAALASDVERTLIKVKGSDLIKHYQATQTRCCLEQENQHINEMPVYIQPAASQDQAILVDEPHIAEIATMIKTYIMRDDLVIILRESPALTLSFYEHFADKIVAIQCTETLLNTLTDTDIKEWLNNITLEVCNSFYVDTHHFNALCNQLPHELREATRTIGLLLVACYELTLNNIFVHHSVRIRQLLKWNTTVSSEYFLRQCYGLSFSEMVHKKSSTLGEIGLAIIESNGEMSSKNYEESMACHAILGYLSSCGRLGSLRSIGVGTLPQLFLQTLRIESVVNNYMDGLFDPQWKPILKNEKTGLRICKAIYRSIPG
ncbi:hypothetical protein AB6D11_06095 [Vibrio splendidus]